MIDYRVAQACNLPIIRSNQGNFGRYSGIGTGVKEYYGVVKGPLDMHFSGEIAINLPFIRVVEHSHPILLIGADILKYYINPKGWT